jgi:hypothetical protein
MGARDVARVIEKRRIINMTMTHLGQFVLRVEGFADWSRSRLEQYPDKKRNVELLDKLAANLRAISPDDRSFVAYGKIIQRAGQLDSDTRDSINASIGAYIARYGLDAPQDGDPAQFLDGLATKCRELVEAAEERQWRQKLLANLVDNSRELLDGSRQLFDGSRQLLDESRRNNKLVEALLKSRGVAVPGPPSRQSVKDDLRRQHAQAPPSRSCRRQSRDRHPLIAYSIAALSQFFRELGQLAGKLPHLGDEFRPLYIVGALEDMVDCEQRADGTAKERQADVAMVEAVATDWQRLDIARCCGAG